MTVHLLSLLVLSGFLHAVWNLLLKQAPDKMMATAWSLLTGALLFSPVLWWSGRLPPAAYPYLVTSVVFEIVYYRLLAAGYTKGDFSLIYPIARGASPGMLALWSWLAGVDSPSEAGLCGLFVILFGLMIVGHAQASGKHFSWSSIGLPLGVAACISVCALLDGVAVRHCSPESYTVMVLGITSAVLFLWLLPKHGWEAMSSEFVQRAPRYLAIGALLLGSYMLAVVVYAQASISYSGAIREISVVFGAVLGWRVLGEPLGTQRAVGALVIFTGILVVAFRG